MAGIMMSPGAITKKHSISYQTINYYTNLGFFVVRRKHGNSRLYDSEEVKQSLLKITKLKNQGYSLRLICDIMKKK